MEKLEIRLRDYRQLVPECSWWRNRDATRTFVVVRVQATGEPVVLQRVWLLEMPHAAPVILDGPEMEMNIESGSLVRWQHVIPTPPDAWDRARR